MRVRRRFSPNATQKRRRRTRLAPLPHFTPLQHCCGVIKNGFYCLECQARERRRDAVRAARPGRARLTLVVCSSMCVLLLCIRGSDKRRKEEERQQTSSGHKVSRRRPIARSPCRAAAALRPGPAVPSRGERRAFPYFNLRKLMILREMCSRISGHLKGEWQGQDVY